MSRLLLGTILVTLTAALPSAAAAVSYGAQIRIYSMTFNPIDNVVGQTHEFTVPGDGAPYTIARTFETSAGFPRLFLMSGISGDYRVYQLTNVGTVVEIEDGNLGARGWRSADFVELPNGDVELYLFEAREGRTQRFTVSSSGSIDTTPTFDTAIEDFEHKSIFSAYYAGTTPRILSYDPMTGDTDLVAPPNLTITDVPYSSGYTEIDHAKFAGFDVRLLFKAVGNPYKPSAENGTHARRLVLQTITGNGFGAATHVISQLDSPYDVVRFYDRPDEGVGFIGYLRDNPTLSKFFRLTTAGNTLSFAPMGGGAIWNGFDDIRTYRTDDTTFLIGVDFDTLAKPITNEESARLASCVHANTQGRVAGYQLALLQGGKERLTRAAGYRSISALDPMTLDTPHDVGSVSKLFTAITTLKLHQDGDLQMYWSIATALNDNSLTGWPTVRRPIDLLAHTTGAGKGSPDCVATTIADHDCSDFLTTAPPLEDDCTTSGGDFQCPRDYENPNYGLLRHVISAATGADDTIELVDETYSRWLSSIMPNGPSCFRPSDTAKFQGLCKAGATCFQDPAGRHWAEGESEKFVFGWNTSCAAGGWVLTARDMVRIVEALRGEQVLSTSLTHELFRTNFVDNLGEPTALGWEVLSVASGDYLGKNGAGALENGAGRSTEILNLPGDAHAALFFNTGNGNPAPRDVLVNAYTFAITPGATCKILGSAGDIADEVIEPTVVEHDAVFVFADHIVTGSDRPTRGLKLESWTMDATGAPSFHASHDGTSWGTTDARHLRLLNLHPDVLIVAFGDANDDLRVGMLTVKANGSFQYRTTQVRGGGVEDLSLVRLDAGGDPGFATVRKKSSGQLEVISWKLTMNQTNFAEVGSHTTAGTILEVDAASDNDRLLAVVRTSTGKVKPIGFVADVANGEVDRLASLASNLQQSGSQIRASSVFVNGEWYFVGAYKDPTNVMRVDVWQPNTFWSKINWKDQHVGTEVSWIGQRIASDIEGRAYVSVRKVDDDETKVRLLQVGEFGAIELLGSDNGPGDLVSLGLDAKTMGAPTRHFILGSYMDEDDTHRMFLKQAFFGEP